MAEMMELYREAENSVLGILIADAPFTAAEVFSRVRPEDFVTGISRHIFQTCQAMYNRGDVIEPLTVKATCGAEFLEWTRELEQIAPSSQYCEAYVDKLLELSQRFRLQKLFRDAMEENGRGLPMEEIIGKIECMNSVLATNADKRNFSMKDMLVRFYSRFGQKRQYIDWGFDEINRFVRVNRKHYVIIGARPSAGKTAFALQVALHMAENHNVTFFSLETDDETISDRMMAMQSYVNLGHIMDGDLAEDETQALIEKKTKLQDLNFNFYEASGITVEEIRGVTNKNKSDVIVIDYLQLIRHRDSRLKEYEATTEITKALQRLAKSGICVIALSQLSRAGEGVSALRGSGQLEQDADVVMMLNYPDKKDLETEDEEKDFEAGRLRCIDIEKNKNGRTGSIPFWFDGAHQRFLAQWKGFYHSKLRLMEDETSESA